MTDWPGPRRAAQAESERRGRGAFVRACTELAAGSEGDDALLDALAGPAASWARDAAPEVAARWRRVWALRGLLWVWDGAALPVVVTALRDEQWRPREMAAKIVARHSVDDALETLLAVRDDPVPRVRRAVERAITALAAGGPGYSR